MPFWNRNKIKEEMIQNLRPTSKASLKQMCLYSSNGDLDKAQKLYDYMIKDMEDLPLFDVVPPTRLEQVKMGVTDTMQWMRENQDQIFTWVDFIRGMFNKGGGNAPIDVASKVVDSIPNINK